jgi:hypothetical protein
MNSITSLPSFRLAARAVARVARWQRRISARLQAGDEFARQAGWTITRTRFGGRIYRDPRLDQLTARAPATPREMASPRAGPPAASSRRPAGTGHQQATNGPARTAESERRNR